MFNLSKILEYLDTKVVENVTHTHAQKSCLLSYITYPFLFPFKPQAHQSHWQVQAIAQAVHRLGYRVDVVNYAAHYQLKRSYDLIIDIHPTRDKPYWKHLKENATTIMFYTGSYPDFQNSAELERLAALRKRRGVQLQPRRQVEKIDRSILEKFNAIFLIGNVQTKKTFPALDIPMYLLPNTVDESLRALSTLPKSPTSFLFLGSGGQVHKGLDLVLEVFRRHPELSLTVCSPFAQEEDFVNAYQTELFESSNITPLGFVDPHSRSFKENAARCAWMIYPSASEGMAGSVLTAMSAGIIPIVSKESGVSHDVEILASTRLESIEKKVMELSKSSQSEITKKRTMMLNSLEKYYSQQTFTTSLCNALQQQLS